MTRYEPPNSPPSGVAPQTWEQEAPLGPSPGVQATMDQMTERMQTVIDAAERAAEAIRLDAEEQARRHLAEARRKADGLTAERVRLISELTDDLIRHAATVRDHSEQMVRALEQAINSVAGKLGEPAPASPWSQEPEPAERRQTRVPPPSQVPPPAVSASAQPPRDPRGPYEPPSQDALVHATRLAVAGNDRETIARVLREDYGIAHPDPLVDRVFGEG